MRLSTLAVALAAAASVSSAPIPARHPLPSDIEVKTTQLKGRSPAPLGEWLAKTFPNVTKKYRELSEIGEEATKLEGGAAGSLIPQQKWWHINKISTGPNGGRLYWKNRRPHSDGRPRYVMEPTRFGKGVLIGGVTLASGVIVTNAVLLGKAIEHDKQVKRQQQAEAKCKANPLDAECQPKYYIPATGYSSSGQPTYATPGTANPTEQGSQFQGYPGTPSPLGSLPPPP